MFKNLENSYLDSDDYFDQIYCDEIKQASEIHFTPIAVIRLVATYLAEKKALKVLDIGSGAGKFCLIGATISDIAFTGVEYRKSLYDASQCIKLEHEINNAFFIHADICNISFDLFDSYYFFNSFHENLAIAERINDEVPLNVIFHNQYSTYVRCQLELQPVGTSLVTYFSYGKEIPPSYQLVKAMLCDKLKFWEKMN